MVDFNPKDVDEIDIAEDYGHCEGAGASGFQVINVILTMNDGSELDVTENIDQGLFYESQKDVARSLGLDPNKIEFTNVPDYD